MTPEEAAQFYEDDEDPVTVLARFDAGGKLVTAAPAGWRSSPAAQIKQGLDYIRKTYGTGAGR